MRNTIKNIIRKSNNSATAHMLAYMDGKTSDALVLSLIVSAVENSNHPNTCDLVAYLLNK